MQFTVGETISIIVAGQELVIKIEDASKSESISGRIEQVKSGSTYTVGQICEFNRNDIQSA